MDALTNYNVHSIVLQVPIADRGQRSRTRTSASTRAPAAASGRSSTKDGTNSERGRLRPGLAARQPADQRGPDPARPEGHLEPLRAGGRLAASPTATRRPSSRSLENLLYGTRARSRGRSARRIDETGRTDLSLILLTGVPGPELHRDDAADLLRLNTAIKPGVNGACPGGTASAAAPDRLAVLDADLCGFPNGRRLGDDVVDIELRASRAGLRHVPERRVRASRTRARTTCSATAWTRTTCRSRTRSRTWQHRTRATRCRKTPEHAGREGPGRPLPPRPQARSTA